MIDGTSLKIDRATEHIAELNELFSKELPFSYILETNAQTRQRATFAKKNEAIVGKAMPICGEVVYDLRSALDHIYWQIVSPYATNRREQRKIQFPFCEDGARLDKAIEDRLGDRPGKPFFDAIKKLRPHGEPGGNKLLYLVEEMNILDKHKTLIPTGDYTRLSGDIIRAQVPDFPFYGTVEFGSNPRDVGWTATALPEGDLWKKRPPDHE